MVAWSSLGRCWNPACLMGYCGKFYPVGSEPSNPEVNSLGLQCVCKCFGTQHFEPPPSSEKVTTHSVCLFIHIALTICYQVPLFDQPSESQPPFQPPNSSSSIPRPPPPANASQASSGRFVPPAQPTFTSFSGMAKERKARQQEAMGANVGFNLFNPAALVSKSILSMANLYQHRPQTDIHSKTKRRCWVKAQMQICWPKQKCESRVTQQEEGNYTTRGETQDIHTGTHWPNVKVYEWRYLSNAWMSSVSRSLHILVHFCLTPVLQSAGCGK